MNETIAVALQPGTHETGHFGHAHRFRIYRDRRFLEQRDTSPFCGRGNPVVSTIDEVLDSIRDCSVVVVSAIGPCGREALEEAGIAVRLFTGGADEAAAFAAGQGSRHD
jgi:predicted Fe-Mo cluster-binding NifX family protein